MFSIPHLHRELGPNSQTNFCWELHEMARTPQIFIVWPAPSHGEGHSAISLNRNVWWKLHEIYRTAWKSCFPIPHITTIGWGVGVQCTNSCNVKHKNVSEPSPTLPYLEVAKHNFSVQIWTFHSIPTKKFYENWPPPLMGWGLVTWLSYVDMDISCNS